MDNCQINQGGFREAVKTGEDLMVAVGINTSGYGGTNVLILASTEDCNVAGQLMAVCIEDHQLDINLTSRLQEKFDLLGFATARCTGTGHDSGQFGEDGFTVNGHMAADGEPTFISLRDLQDEGIVIRVLPEGTEVISTFKAHPKEQPRSHQKSPYSPNVTTRVVSARTSARIQENRVLETVGVG